MLCSREVAGRRAGSPEGARARQLLVDGLKQLGLEPILQAVPGAEGANLLVTVPGRGEASARWVVVAAHYDHLGSHGRDTFWGADDNAAAVAMLLWLCGELKARAPEGRSVLLAFFDAEEPPHFQQASMGSMRFVAAPPVPLERVDLMVCLDLVGHALGPRALPAEVRDSLFVLGAERSKGTAALVDALAPVPGVVPRRADAEVIPPLSDHYAFWQAKVPFLFLTCGRWEHYHRPTDTPDRLDYSKMAATARWLEALTRAACARPEEKVRFTDRRDDRSTLASLDALLAALEAATPLAALARQQVAELLDECDDSGALPADQVGLVQALVEQIESSLAHG